MQDEDPSSVTLDLGTTTFVGVSPVDRTTPTPADSKYRCKNTVSGCFNLGSSATTTVSGLCPTQDVPHGVWTFSYLVFADAGCTGTLLNGDGGTPYTCFDSRDLFSQKSPNQTVGEALDAGLNVNAIECINESCPPPITTCGNPSLGGAASFGVLEIDAGTVTMTLGTIGGDVGIASGGSFKISGSSAVTGTLYLAPGATFTQGGGSTIGAVVTNANLTPAINAAISAAATYASLACTQTFTTWNSSLTVTGTSGTNVICVTNVNMGSGDNILLSGPLGANFIVRVTGTFSMSGGSTIRVAGSTFPQDVVYDIVGTGTVALSGGSGVDGTIFALARTVSLSLGTVNGQIISGQNVTISSGASLLCPPPTPPCP